MSAGPTQHLFAPSRCTEGRTPVAMPAPKETIVVAVDFQKDFRPPESAVNALSQFVGEHPYPLYLTAMSPGYGPITAQNGWMLGQSPADEIHEGVAGLPRAGVVRKSGYSAAPQLLQATNFRSAILAGGDSDGCLLATALGLVDSGKKVYVLRGACFSSGGEAMHSAGLAVLGRSLGDDCWV